MVRVRLESDCSSQPSGSTKPPCSYAWIPGRDSYGAVRGSTRIPISRKCSEDLSQSPHYIAMANPRAFFITFSCYGSRLHGAESGSVDRYHNVFGARRVVPDPARLDAADKLMEHAPYILDASARQMALQAIQEVCAHRAWTLIALQVRTTHVHVVVEAETQPEAVCTISKPTPRGGSINTKDKQPNAGSGTEVPYTCGRTATWRARSNM